MKHNPTSPLMNFEELVARAKASETPLSAHDLERMLTSLQARVAADPQLSAPDASPPPALDAPPAPRFTMASIAGSLGGLGVLAALMLTYGTQSNTQERNPNSLNTEAPQQLELERGTPAHEDSAPKLETTPSPAHHNQPSSLNSAYERQTARKSTATNSATNSVTNSRVALRTSTPLAATDVASAPTPTAPAATAPLESAPAVSAPRAATAPTLDASLARLERAERELRSGQAADALVTLAIPVAPSLTSRAQALRAVALCQSGNKHAGLELAQAHLSRNPRSPYAKRLGAACGSGK